MSEYIKKFRPPTISKWDLDLRQGTDSNKLIKLHDSQLTEKVPRDLIEA